MNDQLQERLKSLASIRPDAAFLARSRMNLMTAITPTPRRFSLESLLPAFRMSFATAALSLLVFVSASEVPAVPQGTVTSLDASAIKAEQFAANATGSVANAAYFKDVAPSVSLALTDIADPSTDWGSENEIKQSLAVLAKNDY